MLSQGENAKVERANGIWLWPLAPARVRAGERRLEAKAKVKKERG
jgi:hypothetical protein